MTVLDRSELEASPLADLHAIADQIGLDGFRRLRKADLIDAILGESGGNAGAEVDAEEGERPRARRRRSPRLRRPRTEQNDEEPAAEAEAGSEPEEVEAEEEEEQSAPVSRSRSRRGGRSRGEGSRRGGRQEADEEEPARVAEGVVDVLGNGSAFLRVDPPDPSDEDVYISAAQVRRCELVSGDRVAGPVRTPRRSERYPSLVRVDTINGDSADSVSDGVRYEDLPVAWPTERLALGSKDKTLEAIEWLTPLGRGSRATIVGSRGVGKSETLRRLYGALNGTEGLELSLVLLGVRPEEVADWQAAEGDDAERIVTSALTFAASAETQGQALERALDAARRIASRGGDAVVLVDGLDGLHPHAARRAMAAARNLREAGSVTIVATASAPVGGETTVIALDVALAASDGEPMLDLGASGTLRAELLVGADGAEAIRKARAEALER